MEMRRHLLGLCLALLAGRAAPAVAQWGPLDEGEGIDPPSSAEIELEPEAGEGGGGDLWGQGSVGVGLWAVGSPSRGGASFAPALAGGGGLALGPLRLQAWGLGTWVRERTSVVTVSQILLSAHGSLAIALELRETQVELGGVIGAAFGSTRTAVEAPLLQVERSSSLRPIWGGRLQFAWRWTRAEPLLELQILRRGWVWDVITAFGFRFGGGSRE